MSASRVHDGLIRHWRALIVAILFQFSFALTFHSIPPTLGLIISDLNLSYFQGGLLMSFFALPGTVVAILGGMISDRFGIKKVGVASSTLMLAGILMAAFSADFLSIAVGRIVSGIGGVTLSIVSWQLLSERLWQREVGFGTGILNSVWPLSTILSFYTFSISGVGWRTFLLLTSVAGIAALTALLSLLDEPRLTPRSRGGRNNLEISKTWRSIWYVCLVGMWFNATLVSFLTFAQDYFGFKGYEIAPATLLSSTVMMGQVILNPVIGYLLTKYQREDVCIVIGGVGLSIMMLLVPIAHSVIPVLLLTAVFVALIPPSIFSIPSRKVEVGNLGLAFGMVTTFFNVGALAGPFVVGLSRDATGNYGLGFLLLSSFSMMGAVIMLLASLLNHARATTAT